MKLFFVLLLLLLVPTSVFSNAKMKVPPKKQALQTSVDQILDDGLLLIFTNSVILLRGHPDQKKLADGDKINCYAMRTDKVYQYEAVGGAKKTARVYLYHGKRLGR